MVKTIKAKRGFVRATRRRPKSGVGKKTATKPLDAVEALVKQSAGLSVSSEKAESGKRQRKEAPKTNRRLVRRERKRRVAGSKRKQKRKGIN